MKFYEVMRQNFLKNQSTSLNLLHCLSFVQGLTCKWTSAQEQRLVLGYMSLNA
jgi:hypothetical protein